MTDQTRRLDPERSKSDRDRYYVQSDKHQLFQKWGKDNDDGESVFPLLKDAFVFAAAVGWANRRRFPLRGRQHVGFWRSFTPQVDVPLLQAIAIADTADPSIIADTGRVLAIAEEYANGGIDIVEAYDRFDRDSTLVALAGLILETAGRTDDPTA